MPATRYSIWGWGGEASTGASNVFNVGITGLAKRADYSEFEVANEIVCMHLGRVLGLPVPAGIVIERGDVLYFVSLKVGIAGERLPPADPVNIASQQPRLACGILIFDSWLVNLDRHDENLAYDSESKSLFAFDHGMALFEQTGKEHLLSHSDTLGINASNHCLAGEVRSFDDFDEWHKRVLSLPEYVIRDVLTDAAGIGFPEEDIDTCTEFLLNRASNLKQLFRDGIHHFPKYSQPLLGNPFSDPSKPEIEYYI